MIYSIKHFKSLAILLLGILLFSCNNIEPKIAEIYLENRNIDIGSLSINDTITQKIYLKNHSDNLLKIDSVGVSCGCTVVSFDKQPVSKKDSIGLTINFIPDHLGIFDKSIVIDANTDPPFTIFHLVGEVK